MAHFAEIQDGIVQRVIVSEQDFINTGKLGDPSNWIETSPDNEFRKQYAGIGYTYSVDNNIFVRPQPFPSWALDENSDWQPPVARPSDDLVYHWNESTQSWDSGL